MARLSRLGAFRRGLVLMVVGSLLLAGGAGGAGAMAGAVAGTPGKTGESVTISRTEYGIPHIQAGNYHSLGYGEGYAFAQDNPCALVQQALTLAGDRSRWFGPTAAAPALSLGGSPPTNLDSDLLYRSVNATGEIQRLLALPVPLGPTAEVRAVVAGYVRGYNQYLRDTGIANLPDQACRGAAWMRPITELDVWRRAYQFVTGVLGGTDQFLHAILAASPPTSGQPAPSTATVPVPGSFSDWVGSNGLALGRSVTTDGSGMVLANPHAGWTGPERLYQLQLSISDQLDVSGATFYGLPLIMPFGHTQRLAFTATAATDTQYTIERLTLVPGDPTSYLADGQRHAMIRQRVTVPVREPDGTSSTQTRTLYRTPDGPVIGSFAGLGWTTTNAYVLHDAQADNLRALNELLAMDRAESLSQLRTAMATYQGLATLNVLAADVSGTVGYIDGSVVPHVTDALAAGCMTTADQTRYARTGVAVLDGSRTACRLGSDPDAIEPGIFGPAEMPQLTRTDYVANSNGSPWLINPAQPMSFPRIIGDIGTDQRPRERLGFDMISQQVTDGGFTLPSLAGMALNDREFFAEQWRDDLLRFCRAHPTLANTAGQPVDVTAACGVLARWDLRADLDSRGEVLFREFFTALNSNPIHQPPEVQWAAVPFDPAHPLTTPSGLNTTLPQVSMALADAVTDLAAHHLPLDTPLRAVQQISTAGGPVPLPGCPNACYNAIVPANQTLTASGQYPDVVGGSTFLTAVELTPDGPHARTILIYGESENVASPHHWDQVRLFAAKQWITERFTAAEIAADPGLRTTTLATR